MVTPGTAPSPESAPLHIRQAQADSLFRGGSDRYRGDPSVFRDQDGVGVKLAPISPRNLPTEDLALDARRRRWSS